MMQLINDMDWTLLRAQKTWLLEKAYTEGDLPAGLLHLIDSLQDIAVAEGVDEKIIYGESACSSNE